jgi:hypothetical protein
LKGTLKGVDPLSLGGPGFPCLAAEALSCLIQALDGRTSPAWGERQRCSPPAAVAAARFALLCQCSPPTATAIARPRSGLYCRLSTDLLLFAFVHAGCAHVSLASRTSQRLTNTYSPPHFRSLPVSSTLPSTPLCPRCQYLPRRHYPLHWTCGVGLLVTKVLLQHNCFVFCRVLLPVLHHPPCHCRWWLAWCRLPAVAWGKLPHSLGAGLIFLPLRS